MASRTDGRWASSWPCPRPPRASSNDIRVDFESAVAGDDIGVGAADGGEDAHAAMSQLFIVADRLHHTPWDADLAKTLAAVAAVVGAGLPPYGVEESTWRQMHDLAVAAVGTMDPDVTLEATATLRDFLRPYV